MNYLVVGGDGFIGSNIVKKLNEDKKNNVFSSTLTEIPTPHITCNLLQDGCYTALLEYIDQSDVIYFMAANVGLKLILSNPVKYYVENELMLDNFLKIASLSSNLDKKTICFASTSEVYGSNLIKGIEDTQITTGSLRSLYSIQKLAGEAKMYCFHKKHKCTCVCHRYFNISGTGQRKGVIYEMLHDALYKNIIVAAKDTYRSFTWVKDAVTQITKNYQNNSYVIENIADDSMYFSMEELAELVKHSVKRITGKDVYIAIADTDNFIKKRGFFDTRVSDNYKLSNIIDSLLVEILEKVL